MTGTMTTMTVATNLTLAATQCCPQCGFDIGFPPLEETQVTLLAAQKQIADLQAQVRLLNQKASSAVDRWADYEDELAQLRAELNSSRASHHQQQQQQPSQPFHSPTNSTAPTVSTPGPTPLQTPSASVTSASPARSSFLSSAGAASRISALLTSRKSTPNLKPSPVSPPPQPAHLRQSSNPTPFSAEPETPVTPAGPSTDELLQALSREQALRREAEGKLSDTSREVEELSVSLFEQANEMVATERRARAKLEERVGMLEKRDAEKKRRLERLESAMDRIDRVRLLLGVSGAEGGETGVEKGGYRTPARASV
jgi:septal ring factor EnvC (AmiA/AmiB activator)